MVFVLVHHAKDAHGRVVGAAVGLQQLIVLGAELLPHLTRGLHQLVLHQRRVLVVGLDMVLAEGGLAHQARLHRPLLSGGAEVTQDVPGPVLAPGQAPGLGAGGVGGGPAVLSVTQAAIAVQIQGTLVGHFPFFLLLLLAELGMDGGQTGR